MGRARKNGKKWDKTSADLRLIDQLSITDLRMEKKMERSLWDRKKAETKEQKFCRGKTEEKKNAIRKMQQKRKFSTFTSLIFDFIRDHLSRISFNLSVFFLILSVFFLDIMKEKISLFVHRSVFLSFALSRLDSRNFYSYLRFYFSHSSYSTFSSKW